MHQPARSRMVDHLRARKKMCGTGSYRKPSGTLPIDYTDYTVETKRLSLKREPNYPDSSMCTLMLIGHGHPGLFVGFDAASSALGEG